MAASPSSARANSSPRVSSPANSRRRAAVTRDAASFATTKLILYSDDDCEIIITLAPVAATAEKTRAAMPGTPIMPAPWSVTRLMPGIDVRALTMLPLPPPLVLAAPITVPGNSGLKVFLIQMGIPLPTAGATVLGCSTLAPK